MRWVLILLAALVALTVITMVLSAVKWILIGVVLLIVAGLVIDTALGGRSRSR